MAVPAASAAAAPAAHVTINGVSVPVTAEPGLDVSMALTAVPFQEWCAAMDPELMVRSIHLQSMDCWAGRVGFLKFRSVTEFHGRQVPGIVFLRGGAVAILLVLRCEGERWAVCCRQPRVPVGKAAFMEIPAGMLDGSGNFGGVAAKELAEETGISIKEADLFDMTAAAMKGIPVKKVKVPGAAAAAAEAGAAGGAGAGLAATLSNSVEEVNGLRGMYPSVGACDEFLRLMYYSKKVERAELEALQGKATGCIEDGEVITLELIPLEDLWRVCPDAKSMSAILLYEKLTAAGQMPPEDD